MFVAAVVIPILIFYFYRRTGKERERYTEEWRNYGKVSEHAVLEGKVLRSTYYKEQFYQNLELLVTELWVEGKSGHIKALKKEPACSGNKQAKFQNGEHVRLRGEWHHPVFYFNDASGQ